MKRAKINIAKTANGSMKYNLYRFKNEPSRTDLNYYLDVDPIAVLDESKENVTSSVIKHCKPNIDDKGEGFEYATLSLPFDFIFKSSLFKVNLGGEYARKIIEIHTNEVSISKFVMLTKDGDKFVKELEITNSSDISKHAVIVGRNGISISKEHMIDHEEVTLTIETKKISFVDLDSNGVFSPEYQVVEKLKEYELHPIVDTQQNVYHYTSIATTKENRISEVSNVASVILKEDPTVVNMRIECSDDYHEKGSEAFWYRLDRVKSCNAYRIIKKEMYSRDIPKFNMNEIKVDDSNVQVYHERILKVPNVWHRDKMSLAYRKLRAYRVINDFSGYLSEYSDVFYKDDYQRINIDKMVIYKKKVTYLDEEDRSKPIQIGDKDAELLRVCVRVGGLYYKDALDKVDYQPIEILSDNSRLPLINIKDRCLYSNHYNYTIYLYDEKGKQSDPYSVVL